MKKIFFTFVLIALISFNTCDENPLTDDNLTPGRRDYVWSVDSIDFEGLPTFIELKSIWGSSPTDVWGSHFTADVRNCLWHYDGTVWKRAVEGTPITNPSGGSSIVGGVWGTAQNDVWAFGGTRFSNPEREAPFVMRFNGSVWTEFFGDTTNMPNGYWDVHGVEKDHFWVASANEVFRYKFGIWKKFFIRDNSVIPSITTYNNQVYLTCYLIGIDSLFLYKFNGTNFNVIDKTILSNGKFGAHGLIITKDKAITFSRNGIHSAAAVNGVIQVDAWANELSVPDNGFFNSYHNSAKDVWAFGKNKYPYHYNGRDWQAIDIFNGSSPPGNQLLFGSWGDGHEIFICDIYNGIIYHGK